MLALVAFGAGGFMGLVAAAADDTGNVAGVRRSATRPDVVAPARLNALPLLPAPAEAQSQLAADPPELRQAVASSESIATQVSTRRVRESQPKPASLPRKTAQHVSKSGSWTRRSEIIDPWSTRR